MNGNFTQIENNVLKKAFIELSGTEYKIWSFLKMMCFGNGKCWPSIQTMAKAVQLSTRQVQRAVKTLEKNGWIRREIVAGRHTPDIHVAPDMNVTADPGHSCRQTTDIDVTQYISSEEDQVGVEQGTSIKEPYNSGEVISSNFEDLMISFDNSVAQKTFFSFAKDCLTPWLSKHKPDFSLQQFLSHVKKHFTGPKGEDLYRPLRLALKGAWMEAEKEREREQEFRKANQI